jgi:hypothetical protein
MMKNTETLLTHALSAIVGEDVSLMGVRHV